MRAAGTLTEPSAAPGAHVCWGYDCGVEFARTAAAFLGDGIARRERLVYVADGPPEALRAAIGPLLDVEELEADGALVLQPVRELYEPDGSFDVGRQVAAYRDLAGAARRDGFAGLRVAADATALVRGRDARLRFVGYELAVDRLMAAGTMTALCAYDRRELGAAVGDLAAVHPLQHGLGDADRGFQAYYVGDALRLTGELDLATCELLEIVLDVARSSGDRIVLDLAGLTFVDGRSLALIANLAATVRAGGGEVELRDPAPPLRHLADLLGFEELFNGKATG